MPGGVGKGEGRHREGKSDRTMAGAPHSPTLHVPDPTDLPFAQGCPGRRNRVPGSGRDRRRAEPKRRVAKLCHQLRAVVFSDEFPETSS